MVAGSGYIDSIFFIVQRQYFLAIFFDMSLEAESTQAFMYAFLISFVQEEGAERDKSDMSKTPSPAKIIFLIRVLNLKQSPPKRAYKLFHHIGS